MHLYKNYFPITAAPFRNCDEYVELAPCQALRPYIRCFWGNKRPIKRQKKSDAFDIVIPDACADIIFYINETTKTIESLFCGIGDQSFRVYSNPDCEQEMSAFAIRFYAWSAAAFSEQSMKDTKNQLIDAAPYFERLIRALKPKLADAATIEERCALAERCLFKNMRVGHENSLLLRALSMIMEQRGNVKALQLATDLHISSKQIERVFHEYIGVTPKKLASLVRYQCLWQDVCFHPRFSSLDAAHQYGYADQAHLLNDFKKFHGLSLREARRYAFKDDEFLQEKYEKNCYDSSAIYFHMR